ncbi:MAG: hypothetical protein JNM25_19055 [Planctomycetes bacterium]|nr:hypothetical protein [Planctomycetota bacterium]
MRLTLLPMLVASLSCLPGCCSLSRFFCGPDRSAWVPQSFDTPQRTAQTLFEALRRDDPEVLYLCLDQSYRQRLGITDSMTMRLAWDRFRERNAGLHVAGYTEVPEPTRLDADHATVAVDVVGRPVAIDFVRRSYAEVRYRRPNGTVGDDGRQLRSFAERAQVAPLEDATDDQSRLMVAPFVFHHDGLDAVPLDAIEHVALTRRWLVVDIRGDQAPAGP